MPMGRAAMLSFSPRLLRNSAQIYKLPNTMKQFCFDLEQKPIVTYLTLLLSSQCGKEHNFQFPPFRCVFNLLKQKGFDTTTLKELETRGYPFSDSSWFIQECIHGGLLAESEKITPILKKDKGGQVIFKFGCTENLSEYFFVRTGIIPVFPLGVSYSPTDYDFRTKQEFTPRRFYLHDRQHAAIILNDYQDEYIDYLENRNIHVYPLLDNYLFSTYMLTIHCRLKDKDLKKAVELLFFQLLHEDSIKSRRFEVIYRPAGIWDKEYFIEYAKDAIDLLKMRLRGSFAYSNQYKSGGTFVALTDAEALISEAAKMYQAPTIDDNIRLSYLSPTEENVGSLIRLLGDFEQKSSRQAEDFILHSTWMAQFSDPADESAVTARAPNTQRCLII
jgi:hypothetical protein